mmetsp:Transcript_18161/g.42204  ORF Transcript_18161/g.42204 Transcript_18161/m.42204 type:complete len:976 (+) Transcript_18161:100-3027(+)
MQLPTEGKLVLPPIQFTAGHNFNPFQAQLERSQSLPEAPSEVTPVALAKRMASIAAGDDGYDLAAPTLMAEEEEDDPIKATQQSSIPPSEATTGCASMDLSFLMHGPPQPPSDDEADEEVDDDGSPEDPSMDELTTRHSSDSSINSTPLPTSGAASKYPSPPFDPCLVQWAMRNPSVRRALADPARVGILVEDLEDLYLRIRGDMCSYCSMHGVDEKFRHVCLEGPLCPFDHQGAEHVHLRQAQAEGKSCVPMEPNLHLVVTRYIKPWTKNLGLSYAGALLAHKAATWTRQTVDDATRLNHLAFISHNWNEHFADFVTTALNAIAKDKPIWVCAFTINQNADIGEALGTDLSQVPFARALSQAERVIVFMDHNAATLSRSWVVFEAYLAVLVEKKEHFHVAFPDNSNTAAWTAVAHQLEHLDVRTCKASVQHDHDLIMAYIRGHEDELNTAVKGAIARACNNARALAAARVGDLEALRMHPNPACEDAGFTSTVHFAAEAPQPDALEYLLNLNPNSKVRNKDGETPLHFAARSGNVRAAQMLLATGENVEETNQAGARPVHLAAGAGHVEIVKEFVTLGAEMDACDHVGNTALHYAAMGGHVEVSRGLVGEGAPLGAVEGKGRTALHLAVEHGHTDLTSALVGMGARIDVVDKEGDTPLHGAACNGQTHIITMLVELGASVNGKSDRGWGPLYYAALYGHTDTVLKLVQLGAVPEEADPQGMTALHVAASHGHGDAARALATVGASLKQKTRKGKTVLHLAAASNGGEAQIIEELIQMGAEVDAVDIHERTALHFASLVTCGSNMSAIIALVKAGADINAKDDKGRTPLHLASEKGELSIVEHLLLLRADVNVVDNAGKTPLHRAAHFGHTALASSLVRSGSKLDAMDLKDRTPVDAARANGNAETAELLCDLGANCRTHAAQLPCRSELLSIGGMTPGLRHQRSNHSLETAMQGRLYRARRREKPVPNANCTLM